MIRVFQNHNSEVAKAIRVYSPSSLIWVDDESIADISIVHNTRYNIQKSNKTTFIVVEHEYDGDIQNKMLRLRSWQNSLITVSPTDLSRISNLKYQPRCRHYHFPFGADSYRYSIIKSIKRKRQIITLRKHNDPFLLKLIQWSIEMNITIVHLSYIPNNYASNISTYKFVKKSLRTKLFVFRSSLWFELMYKRSGYEYLSSQAILCGCKPIFLKSCMHYDIYKPYAIALEENEFFSKSMAFWNSSRDHVNLKKFSWFTIMRYFWANIYSCLILHELI